MLRIGIIGSDSSHAPAFAGLCNLPGEDGRFPFPGVRVTHIWGQEAGRTREVAAGAHIENTCATPGEMLGAVDAVMVVLRHGGLHRQYALPFIEAGVPTWVDKPFATTLADARALTDAAARVGGLLAGGSTCKYCPDVLWLAAQRRRLGGGLLGANLNFPAEPDSPYGGIHFYGGHTAEMLTTIFGDGVRSVKADLHGGTLVTLFRYDRFVVTVHGGAVAQFAATLYSAAETLHRPIDISTVYREGLASFTAMLRGEKPPMPAAGLLRPVAILEALEAAIKTGREAAVQIQ